MKFHSVTKSFIEKGFYSPVKIFNKDQCKLILEYIKSNNLNFNNLKNSAIKSSLFYEIARNSKIIDIVSSLIGENILLWGACLVNRKPGTSHPWHTDIETSESLPGKTVSVWIGLKDTKESTLKLISHSHTFNKCYQQVAHENNIRRGKVDDTKVTEWSQKIFESSKLITISLADGEAIFFDGKLWHSSQINNSSKYRTAILLQYTKPENKIFGINPKNLEWPFENKDISKPKCLLINGVDTHRVNEQAEPPEPDKKIRNKISPKKKKIKLKNLIQSIELPLKENKEKQWKPYYIFKGNSKSLDHITSHISVLSPEHSPHPPHTHVEEEILIMISGEADIVSGKEEKRLRLKPGQFSYYPSFYPHTIDNNSSEPATYMMFKWYNNKKLKTDKILSKSIFNYKRKSISDLKNRVSKKVFESSTLFLKKLHCHTTLLKPGGGYEPHKDNYDVAIVLLEGEIETLGKKIKPLSLIYHPKGEPHGIKNVGNSDAFYLVFEFHGKSSFLPSIHNITFISLKKRIKRLIKELSN